MTAPAAVIVSYRLGGSDGVGVESAKWEWALRELGFTTRRVAGEFAGTLRTDDTVLPFLAIAAGGGASSASHAVARAIQDADLVVVENLCSLPLNLDAATTVRDVLARHPGRVCFHHHDFAWERPHLAHIEGFPPRHPNSLHVTISDYARRALEDRGFAAVCIHNSFDFSAFDGDRQATRLAFGFAEDDAVLLQPTRAIPRKGVAAGLRFAGQMSSRLKERAVRYWITGPAEDGFDAHLDALVSMSPVPVRLGRTARAADAYAAADLVVFPSTWEGFGNPVVESVAARRMPAVGWYPALPEIIAGMTILSVDDPDGAATWLRHPSPEQLEHNLRIARARFAVEDLPARIRAAFATVGWTDW